MTISPAERAMIFGGGIDLRDDRAYLSPASRQRVNRFLEEHHNNTKRFTSRNSLVVCTGGYGLLAAGVIPPAERQWREGHLMADALVQAEFPAKSISTLTNWTYSMQLGLIAPGDFAPDNPLGLVSHPYHLNRITDIGQRLEFTHVERIATHETDRRGYEMMLRALYGAALFGAHDPAKLEARETEVIGRALAVLRGTNS